MAAIVHDEVLGSLDSSDSETASTSNSYADLPLGSPAQRADSAWGRASFTEAEIKKAFEVADADRKSEELASASAKSANASASKTKGSSKSGKKKDDSSKSKRTGKDKGSKKSVKLAEVEDDLHDESREAGDWDELIRACGSYDDYVEPVHFEMNEEQLKCDTFDEWAAVTEAQLAVGPDESSNKFDPFAQRAVREICAIFTLFLWYRTFFAFESDWRIFWLYLERDILLFLFLRRSFSWARISFYFLLRKCYTGA